MGRLGGGHTDFVIAAITSGLAEAFASLRWPGWQEEVSALRPDQGLSLYPPPFTGQGHNPASVSRKDIPFSELLGFYDDCSTQINTPPTPTTGTHRPGDQAL